jgi:hypothetical protein
MPQDSDHMTTPSAGLLTRSKGAYENKYSSLAKAPAPAGRSEKDQKNVEAAMAKGKSYEAPFGGRKRRTRRSHRKSRKTRHRRR